MDEYLSIKEVMAVLKICRSTLFKHVRSGRLASYRIGRLVRIKAGDLKQFIEGKPSKNKSN